MYRGGGIYCIGKDCLVGDRVYWDGCSGAGWGI